MIASKKPKIEKGLPEKMKVERLGDIAKSVKGKKPPNLSSETSKEFTIPYVDIKAFEKKVFNNYTDGVKCSLCEIDDVLVVWDGARCGLVGRGVKGAIGSTLAKIESSVLIKPYLFYFFQSIYSKINTNPKGVGIPHVDPTILWDSQIAVPSNKEQNRIVEKIEELFSELDYAISTLKNTQQQLKSYRRSLLFNTFSFKKGWTNGIIDDVCICLDNKRKPVNKKERQNRVGEIPYYGANGQTGWIDDYLFNEDLILVVEDETFTGREAPFCYKIQGKSWVNNHAHILKPKKDLDIDFLNYSLWFYPFTRLTTGTTGRKKLTKYALMNAPYCFPPIKEQKKIVSEIETSLSEADYLLQTINQQLIQAESLRQSILQKAFSGEL